MQCHKHVSHMWVETRCVCVYVHERPRQGRVCVCARQIYDAGPELWCSQLPFIICHLTTHEIHRITSPLPFCVKFSPFLPDFFSSHFHVGRSLPSHGSAHVCVHAKAPYTPCLPTPFSHLHCLSSLWAQKGKELRGRREEVYGRMRGHGFKCFHSCLEH